jgi:hypothetical protein
MMADDKIETVSPDKYRCVHYPDSKTNCAKYLYDEWDIYDGDIPCSQCEHYLTEEDIEYLRLQGKLPFAVPE